MIEINAATIITATALTTIVYAGFNLALASIVSREYKKICELAKKLMDGKVKLMSVKKPEDLTRQSGLDKEYAAMVFLNAQREEINYFTRIISCIELILFGGLAFVLYSEDVQGSHVILSKEHILILLTAFGAWMALKVFGSYGQWSGWVFGRATYYLFLIGSIANCVVSVIIGFVLAFFFIR